MEPLKVDWGTDSGSAGQISLDSITVSFPQKGLIRLCLVGNRKGFDCE